MRSFSPMVTWKIRVVCGKAENCELLRERDAHLIGLKVKLPLFLQTATVHNITTKTLIKLGILTASPKPQWYANQLSRVEFWRTLRVMIIWLRDCPDLPALVCQPFSEPLSIRAMRIGKTAALIIFPATIFMTIAWKVFRASETGKWIIAMLRYKQGKEPLSSTLNNVGSEELGALVKKFEAGNFTEGVEELARHFGGKAAGEAVKDPLGTVSKFVFHQGGFLFALRSGFKAFMSVGLVSGTQTVLKISSLVGLAAGFEEYITFIWLMTYFVQTFQAVCAFSNAYAPGFMHLTSNLFVMPNLKTKPTQLKNLAQNLISFVPMALGWT